MTTNPFALLGVPESFDLCPELLECHYEKSMGLCHPDRASTPLLKKINERLACKVVQAYRTLKNPVERAHVLLENNTYLPLPSFPDLIDDLFLWQESNSLSAKNKIDARFKEACCDFSKALHNKDKIGSQRAYWWMLNLNHHMKK